MANLGEYFKALANLDEEQGDPNEEVTSEENKDDDLANNDPPVEEDGEAQEDEDSLDEEVAVMVCGSCGFMGTLDEDEGCPICGSESLDEATVKVVRDGKVITKKKTTKKHKLTAAQKAALAKARKKAHTPSAERNRGKSMKTRKKKGLNEEESVCRCPECGYEGSEEEFEIEDE